MKVILFKKLIKRWNNHYNNIKDVAWPTCLSFRHINRLPDAIQQEVLASPYTQKILSWQWAEEEPYGNDAVYADILPWLNSADIVVKLQDIVNTNGEILEDLLEIPTMNNAQHKLIERWKKLHPQELLEKIGITP